MVEHGVRSVCLVFFSTRPFLLLCLRKAATAMLLFFFFFFFLSAGKLYFIFYFFFFFLFPCDENFAALFSCVSIVKELL